MRSLRVTLNLWYVAILAAVLCLFSVVFYFNTASNFARDVDKTLLLQADGVADTIFAFWRAERAAASGGPGNWLAAPAQTFEGEISQGGLPALLSRWAEKTGNLDIERPIRLLDNTGQILGASPNVARLELPLSPAAVAQARGGHTIYETLALPRSQRIRIVTRPAMNAGRVLYCIQIAASLQAMDVLLARLRFWLLVLIPSMLVVTSSVGWTLASAAQGSIHRVIIQARRFIADSLHERPDEVLPARDELEQLDTTFNDMLIRVERAFRRLRQFSAAASHELRTPLTVMKGEIEVTLRKPRSPEEYLRVLHTQLKAIDELTHTVEELLRLAQTDATEGEMGWSLVELGALARRMAEIFKRAARKQAMRVEVSVREPVWVRGEQRLLERLLANLLENAMKYTPPNTLVTILVEPWAEEARLIVRDTGPGVPPEQIQHLFDQFFRRRPDDNGSRSTGLGLGLCRWIAELHHGHIEVASTPGSGTTFTIRLPLVVSPAFASSRSSA